MRDEMEATLLVDGLPQYAPTTNLYETSDGRYLLVTVDTSTADNFRVGGILVARTVAADTVVFLADQDANVLDANGDISDGMTPLLVCEPGTSHADALAAAGYRVLG